MSRRSTPVNEYTDGSAKRPCRCCSRSCTHRGGASAGAGASPTSSAGAPPDGGPGRWGHDVHGSGPADYLSWKDVSPCKAGVRVARDGGSRPRMAPIGAKGAPAARPTPPVHFFIQQHIVQHLSVPNPTALRNKVAQHCRCGCRTKNWPPPLTGGTTKWLTGSFLPDLPSAIKQTSADAQRAVELTL